MESKKEKICEKYGLKIGDTVFYAAVGRMLKVAGFADDRYCDDIYLEDDKTKGVFYIVKRFEIRTMKEVYGD